MFGSQTHERRQARAEARKAITRAEKAALRGTDDAFDAALEDLETAAMLAAFPRFLTDLYRKARKAHSADAATEAVRLFVNATWHPWAGALRRWYRARKLSQMLEGSSPVVLLVSPETHSYARPERIRAMSVPERAANCGYPRSLTDIADGLRSGHRQVDPLRETTF